MRREGRERAAGARPPGCSCDFGISGKCETCEDCKQGNDVSDSEFFEISVAAPGADALGGLASTWSGRISLSGGKMMVSQTQGVAAENGDRGACRRQNEQRWI